MTYGICGWGNCALTFQRKIVTLQKRALRLIYFSKSKEHAVPFFLKSNCLPLPSIFFRDCSYLLYDINRQTAPVSIPFSFPELRSFWSAAGIESSGWFQFAVRKLRTSGSTAQPQTRNPKATKKQQWLTKLR